MGRYPYSQNALIEDCRKISTALLKDYGYFYGKKGSIEWSDGFKVYLDVFTGKENYLNIRYYLNKSISYRINLVISYPNYGGKRYWFKCPNISCGSVVSALYLPSNGQYFACRHCYNLFYKSSRLSGSKYSRYKKMLKNDPENCLSLAMSGNLDAIKVLLDVYESEP